MRYHLFPFESAGSANLCSVQCILYAIKQSPSRVCRFHIAVAGFVYQAEKVGFRQQEIIHGSVNFENYTLFSACAHEYNWQKTHTSAPVKCPAQDKS